MGWVLTGDYTSWMLPEGGIEIAFEIPELILLLQLYPGPKYRLPCPSTIPNQESTMTSNIRTKRLEVADISTVCSFHQYRSCLLCLHLILARLNRVFCVTQTVVDTSIAVIRLVHIDSIKLFFEGLKLSSALSSMFSCISH